MCFSWKGCVYRQLFYITNANDSPNLLSRDGCYTLSVIKHCYSVESTANSGKFQENTKMTATQHTATTDKARLQGDSFKHCKMKELCEINVLVPVNPASQRMNFSNCH